MADEDKTLGRWTVRDTLQNLTRQYCCPSKFANQQTGILGSKEGTQEEVVRHWYHSFGREVVTLKELPPSSRVSLKGFLPTNFRLPTKSTQTGECSGSYLMDP